MPLPGGQAILSTWLKKNAKRKEADARLAKLAGEQDTRPMHQRLSCTWAGRSVHTMSGDVTTWDNVNLELVPDVLKDSNVASPSIISPPGGLADVKANVKSASPSAASAAAAPSSINQHDAKSHAPLAESSSANGAIVATIVALRGLVRGKGSSCWRKYVIPFTLSGEYDLETNVMRVTKQHWHTDFSNAVYYTLKMVADPNAPNAGFVLSSDSPNLRLSPLLAAPPSADKLNEREACKACLERPINCVLLPCAHLCVCAQCAVGLKNICPICRAEFIQALVVYPT